MSESAWGWRADPAAVGATTPTDRVGVTPASVVGLGAICDLRPPQDHQRNSQSFSVGEFATLGNGDRLMLHQERGFTMSGAVGDSLPGTVIVRQVLHVVLRDESGSNDHSWSELAELARSRGLDVTADQLRQLPYEVLVTDRILRWLEQS
jgi:hypothetical protein